MKKMMTTSLKTKWIFGTVLKPLIDTANECQVIRVL